MSSINWQSAGNFKDIEYHKADGIAKITINRPEVRNAFRPKTLFELRDAFDVARDDPETGVIVLTGEGGNFCSNPACHGRSWPEMNLNAAPSAAATPKPGPAPASVPKPASAPAEKGKA